MGSVGVDHDTARFATATIKRYEDNNGTISAFLSGQVQLVATGNVFGSPCLGVESCTNA